jgi:hypothetical protein
VVSDHQSQPASGGPGGGFETRIRLIRVLKSGPAAQRGPDARGQARDRGERQQRAAGLLHEPGRYAGGPIFSLLRAAILAGALCPEKISQILRGGGVSRQPAVRQPAHPADKGVRTVP